MKRMCFLFWSVALAAAAAETTKIFSFDCEAWREGAPPQEVFVVDGTIKIAARDGGKAITIDPNPITDATAQLGDSSSGSSSIAARVFASKKGRSTPRFGVSVHGMNGYRLIVNPARKTLDLVKSDEVIKSVPYTWTTDTWTRIRLDVKKTGDTGWSITGKAWPAEGEEPKEPLIQHTDDTLKGQGKAAIWGTPFSETPIFFDDIQVEITVPA